MQLETAQMKKLLTAVLIALSSTAFAATLSPVSLINPAGSTAGQVIVSTGPGTAPSWSSALGPLSMSSSGQFYQGSGAKVNRINDRLFVGPATLNNGTNAASQPDWWTQYQLAKGRTYGFIQTAQMAVLNDSAGKDSLMGIVTGAQTTGRPSSGAQVMGITAIGVNNANTSQAANAAWAGYFEAFRDTTVSGNGGAYGIEIDTMNFTNATPVTDPYSQANDQTIGIQMASGGGFSGTLYPTTVGLNFQNNNTTFDKGIVFGSNSITGATGTSGSGVAIALGRGHMLQWYGSAGVATSSILANGTTAAGGVSQQFSDNAVAFNNASAKSILKVLGVASGVNGVQVLGAATGQAVAVQAIGDDTNIPLQISGKGTSGVQIQGRTNGTLVAAGGVAETMSSTFSSVNMASSGVAQNLGSITLTPGDWDVEGYVTYTSGTGATMTIWAGGLSTVTATLPGVGNYFQSGGSITATGAATAIAPVSRQNVTSNTTINIVGLATFSGGAVSASGFIRARRY
jgi:hypothetical protein